MEDFGIVEIPFSSFSDCWNAATGHTIKHCKDYPEYCPNENLL